jgi:hypothetical protein
MNDFVANNIITIWVGVFVFEVLMGMLAQTIAEKKGHPRHWFWAGLLLSLVGVIWAAGLPDETMREQLRRLHEAPANLNPKAVSADQTVAASKMVESSDDVELAAVLSAAVAAYGEEEDKRFVMRSFRPAGEGSTAWNRAGRAKAASARR